MTAKKRSRAANEAGSWEPLECGWLTAQCRRSRTASPSLLYRGLAYRRTTIVVKSWKQKK